MDERIALIGRRIKFLRIEKGLSQIELANKIGITQTNMSNMENGRVGITLQNFLKMKDIFGCKMKDFFVDVDGAESEISSEDLQEAVKILQMLKGK